MNSLKNIKNYSTIILKIFYYSDILGNLVYSRHERDRSVHKNDFEHLEKCKYVDLHIHFVIDMIKKQILGCFQDLNKIKINTMFYDENNKYHNFIFDFRKLILKDKKIINNEIDINNTLIFMVFDENGNLFFIGNIDFRNDIIKNRIIQYLNYKKRNKQSLNINKKLINIIKVFQDEQYIKKTQESHEKSCENNDENNQNKDNQIENTGDFCFPYENFVLTRNNNNEALKKIKEKKNKELYENYIQVIKKFN